jgi:hypothetical protein
LLLYLIRKEKKERERERKGAGQMVGFRKGLAAV